MNAEKLIIYLKSCVDKLNDDNIETHMLPTTGDPTETQHNVSFIIMDKVMDGDELCQIPKFTVNVNTFARNNDE